MLQKNVRKTFEIFYIILYHNLTIANKNILLHHESKWQTFIKVTCKKMRRGIYVRLIDVNCQSQRSCLFGYVYKTDLDSNIICNGLSFSSDSEDELSCYFQQLCQLYVIMCSLRYVQKIAIFYGYKNAHLICFISMQLSVKITIASQMD